MTRQTFKSFLELHPPLIFFICALIVRVIGYQAGLVGVKVVVLTAQWLSAWVASSWWKQLRRARLWLFLCGLRGSGGLGGRQCLVDEPDVAVAVLPLGLFAYALADENLPIPVWRLVAAGVALGCAVSLTTNLLVFAGMLPAMLLWRRVPLASVARHGA